MPYIIIPPRWQLKEQKATPESCHLNRRQALQLGALGIGTVACERLGLTQQPQRRTAAPRFFTGSGAVKRSPRYLLDRPLTDEVVAGSYNNFYEFTTDKEEVGRLSRGLTVRPWTVAIGGLVERPLTLDLADLVKKMALEERLYRHRCVEAWSMAVPWIGFPLRDLVKLARPLSSARYVRFLSLARASEMPGIRAQPWYPWPYFEGLSLAEAVNELAFCATGIYGHDLPPQHGAPLRLAIPWKYGYKSAKSVVRVEFLGDQPETFWHKIAPDEYSFESNVNPKVPHPRWSQQSERVIGTMERRPTLPYNGYGEFVAHLYKDRG